MWITPLICSYVQQHTVKTDQPTHPHSLIKVFIDNLKKP